MSWICDKAQGLGKVFVSNEERLLDKVLHATLSSYS